MKRYYDIVVRLTRPVRDTHPLPSNERSDSSEMGEFMGCNKVSEKIALFPYNAINKDDRLGAKCYYFSHFYKRISGFSKQCLNTYITMYKAIHLFDIFLSKMMLFPNHTRKNSIGGNLSATKVTLSFSSGGKSRSIN